MGQTHTLDLMGRGFLSQHDLQFIQWELSKPIGFSHA